MVRKKKSSDSYFAYIGFWYLKKTPLNYFSLKVEYFLLLTQYNSENPVISAKQYCGLVNMSSIINPLSLKVKKKKKIQ